MARHSPIAGLGLIVTALAIGIAAQSGTAGGKLDPVKVAASAVKPGNDGDTTVTVKLTIAKSWHIYANPVGHEDLAAAQTTVIVKSAGKPVAAKVKYPAGTAHTEKDIGSFKIYEGNITIQADVPKSDGPLEVSVRFQACDAKQCLLPKTVKINLP
jgi:Disulphide bond corrector protein DsbC